MCTQRRPASGACCGRGSTLREGGCIRCLMPRPVPVALLGGPCPGRTPCAPCHFSHACARACGGMRRLLPGPMGEAARRAQPGRPQPRAHPLLPCCTAPPPAGATRPPPRSACLCASRARCRRGRWPRREWSSSSGARSAAGPTRGGRPCYRVSCAHVLCVRAAACCGWFLPPCALPQ